MTLWLSLRGLAVALAIILQVAGVVIAAGLAERRQQPPGAAQHRPRA